MRTLFLDLQNGIAGDMAVAALLNMNVMPFEEFNNVLKSLSISNEFNLEYMSGEKFGILGGDFFVIEKNKHMSVCENGINHNGTNEHTHEHKFCVPKDDNKNEYHGRNLSDIIKIIETSKISVKAKELAKEIFNNLADAEAKAHNKKISEIHFHEVGAVDSIVDIIGFSVLFTKLKIDMVICSDINLGQGTVKCDHGVLNVPVPAVLNLVKGFPVYCDDIKFELATPTGAAIVKTIAKKFDNNFNGNFIAKGTGFGKRNIISRPNALEIFLLEQNDENEIIEINTNIDNTTAEDLGYCAKLLLKAGALDVCFSPIFMKKFRPGYKLEVLCKLSDLKNLSEIIFKNTGTIGLRYSVKQRIVLNRTESFKDTKLGKIKTKIVHLNNSEEECLEYDSLEEICDKNNLSIKDVRTIAKKF